MAKCEHKFRYSLEHGFMECINCYTTWPPPGLDWNLQRLPDTPKNRENTKKQKEYFENHG